jgi:hypothetical protein
MGMTLGQFGVDRSHRSDPRIIQFYGHFTVGLMTRICLCQIIDGRKLWR